MPTSELNDPLLPLCETPEQKVERERRAAKRKEFLDKLTQPTERTEGA